MSEKSRENFRLLDLSSDQESSDLQLEIIPRKKKITRRERNRVPPIKPPEVNLGSEIQCALRWAVRASMVIWLITLTWLCTSLYDQVSVMRIDISKVSTSSDGVGDALQLCHTAAKELRANASELSVRLAKLEQENIELSKRVEVAEGQLSAVANKLTSAPSLADTPRRLAELQRTVANIGSQINGFDSALQSAHKQAVAATTSVDEVRNSLHDVELRANDTIANVTSNTKKIDDLSQLVAGVNTTLSGRVDSLQMRIDDATRTSSTTAPTTPAPTPSSISAAPSAAPVAAAAAGGTNTSITTTLGTPPKPSILQS